MRERERFIHFKKFTEWIDASYIKNYFKINWYKIDVMSLSENFFACVKIPRDNTKISKHFHSVSRTKCVYISNMRKNSTLRAES